MKTKRHGLNGVGNRSTIAHSDVNSRDHMNFKKKKGEYVYDTVMHPLYVPPSGPKPIFLEQGCLKTDGNLCWVSATEEGGMKLVDGNTMVKRLEEFVSEVDRHGGSHRDSGVKNKNGGNYLKKSETKPLERQTILMPPWFSKIWAAGNRDWRVKAKEIVTQDLLVMAKERWPGVEIKAISLHDDTSNLHFDIWGTELEKKTVPLRNKTVVKFVTKGQVFNSGLCGPGTMFLQAKKDLGHELHAVDETKLKRSLEMYQKHREITKKLIPEVPEEILFYRKIDAKLTSYFGDETVLKYKKLYLEYCKTLDMHKYSVFNELEETKNQALEIKKSSVALEIKKAELDQKEISIEAAFDDLAAKSKELEYKENNLEKLLETVSANDKPTCDAMIKVSKSPDFKGTIRKYPNTFYKMIEKLKPNKDPEVVKLCLEVSSYLEVIKSEGINK